MNDNQAQNGKRNENGRNSVLAAIVGAALGGSGGIGLYLTTPLGQTVARPDPYTGTQGAALEERVDGLEDEVHYHFNNHPDVTNEFDRRITRLETQIELILSNQQRILQRLER